MSPTQFVGPSYLKLRKGTYTGTWHSVRDSIILLLRTFVTCDGCYASDAIRDLRESQRVKKFMRSDEYKAGELIVDATLCDHQGGYYNFTVEEFGIEPNTCVNHSTGIGASTYSHSKYFLSQVCFIPQILYCLCL